MNTIRLCRPVALVICFLVLADSVSRAGPGDGLRVGKVRIRPHVSVSGTYDSNVFLTGEGEESDMFWQLQAGLDASMTLDALTLELAALSYSRTYSSTEPAEDAEISGGASLRAAFGRREKLAVEITPSYQRVQDYSWRPRREGSLTRDDRAYLVSEDRSERERRDLIDVGVSVGRNMTDKTELDVAYGYHMVDYVESDLFDQTGNRAGVSAGYKVTAKSALYLDYGFGIQDSEGTSDEAVSHTAHAGWRTRLSDKTSFRAGAGVEVHDDGTDDAGGIDSRQEVFSLDVAGYWRAAPKVMVSVAVGDSIEPSSFEANNTREVRYAAGSASWRFTRDVSVSAGLSARSEEYRRPSEAVGATRETYSYGITGRLGYAPPRRLYSASLTASHELLDSNLPNEDYDQTRVALQLTLRY